MLNASLAALALFACLGLIMACTTQPSSHDDTIGSPDLVITSASSQLKNTKVVPYFHAPITPNQNLLWCSTMQLAWNELSTLVTGGTGTPGIGMPPNPLAAELLIARGSTNDIDSNAYVAHAGIGPDTINQIRTKLSQTFKGAASPKLLPATLGPDAILAYAYLFKNLEFETPFIKSKAPIPFDAAKLNMWGCWDDHLAKDVDKIRRQVRILAYVSPTNWCVELTTKDPTDRLIIARLEPAPTLAATCDAALALATGPEMAMGMRDTLKVPYLNFDITESFAQLTGTQISGAKASGTIDTAIQNIRFKLDERGAILKSEAVMGVTSAPMIRDQPKIMICDGPFLIQMLKKDATTPYFAAWIANPEILTKN
ncbi:MAG: hypothetical protein NTV94_11920 [Planctomycetota bacterium]|nr:hypothetical protein [Planctomycetota bacterium]